MEQCRITIPQEIVEASKIDFNKPVYLYTDFEILYLSNRKKLHNCFGMITCDKEYTFTLSQDTLNAVLGCSHFTMYVSRGKIFITDFDYSWNHMGKLDKDRKFTIPSEILAVCKVDFSKPVYMYMTESDKPYLSNHKSLDRCLGLIPFDAEKSFYLSDNMCYSLGIISPSNISAYVSKNVICFKVPNYIY